MKLEAKFGHNRLTNQQISNTSYRTERFESSYVLLASQQRSAYNPHRSRGMGNILPYGEEKINDDSFTKLSLN